MTQSTFSAQVANNLLTVLQGYSKTIRLLLVMFLTLTASANAWSATWEKATSIAAGDVVLLVCESKKMELSGISTTSTKYGTGVSYTTSPAGAYELTVEAGSSTGTYSLKNGSNYLYWSSGNSLATNATKSANSSWSITFNNGNATIKNAKDNARIIGWNASSPRFACYTSSQTAVQLYKKVTAVQTVAVTGVSLNPTSLTLTVGSSETLSASVSPDNATDKTVTWTTNKSSVATVSDGKVTAVAEGSATITVTTNDGNKTATCTVTVTPKPKYTVTLVPGSGSVTSTTLTEASAGAGVTLPTPTLDCGDWEFAGWATSAVSTETTTKPTLTPAGAYSPTSNITLYAVYQRTEETEGGDSTPTEVSKTYTFSEYEVGTQYAEETYELDDDVTINIKGCHINTQLRVYGGQPGIVISEELPGRIVSMGFNMGYKADKLVVSGSTDGTSWNEVGRISTTTSYKDYTLDFEETNYTYFKLNVEGSNQIRIAKMSITYESTSGGGSSSTTYYHSTPDCGGVDPEPTGYTITFEANGGNKINKIENATTLPNPLPGTERAHYTFAGWFTDEDCTQAATAGAEINADITLYAKWTPITYTVTFNAGSGTCNTTTTTGDFKNGLTLPTATPCDYASTNGWIFVGWSESRVSETTVRPAIHTGNYKPTDNIILHAVYAKTGTAQGAEGEFILSLQYEGTTYYVGQTFDNSKLSAETERTNAARFTIEDNYLHYEGGYISHVSTSTDITRQANKEDAEAWTIADNGSTITFTSTADETRGLGFNYNNGSPRFAAYKLNEKEKDGETIKYPSTFTKTSVSGGNVQVTTYNSNPACKAPVDPKWEDATISHAAIQVVCGSKTLLGAAAPNGPATITFNGYDLQNSVTVTASEGFLVSTNKEKADTYEQKVTVNPHKDGQNIGKIQNVYVIADATAKTDDFTGTITLTGADITNGSQVINVTAAVTCTQYTITWSVNGDDSHQVTYSPGDALQLPEIDVTPCDGMDHVGWTDNMGYVHGTDLLFAETTGMTVTANQTYYAVFATLTSSGDGETTTTLDFSQQGYANGTAVTSLAKDGVTVTFDQGSGNTAPAYYTTGTAIRVYANGTFTVSSENTISAIVITFGSGDKTNEITADKGTYSNGTWEGSANSVTFTVGGTKDHRRIQSIAVTSAGGGAGYYTGHTTTCSGSQQLATPTNLQATDITYNGATLTWDAVAGANKYKVVINGTEYISNTNSYTTHDLKQQTAYTWTVQAIGNGTTFTDSEISAEATFTTGAELIITWSVSTATSTTTITKGQPIGANLKTPATPAACEGKYFMGWSASSTVNSDGSDFTPITSATIPETNVTYYAVFAEPTGNGGAEGNLFSESFNTMNGKGGNDGTWNGISSSTEVSIDGWSFTKGYVASQCIRLGTGSVAGEATTPALGINGSATLTFNAGAWNAQDEKTQINLTIVGEGSIEPSSVTLTKGQFTTYTANIKGANADTQVKFSAATKNDNRFFLDEVKVSGGTGNTTYTDYSTSCGIFTITYYGFNSGGYTTTCNDNPAVDEVEQGGTYVIPNCEPTFDPAKLGRTFAGTWNTQANGKGTAYKPGDEIVNVCNDITLYAQWALNTSEENTTLPTDVEDLATTDVVVTGGTTLTLQAGTTTINSLTLKGGIQADGSYKMPIINIPDNATLKRKSDIIYLDLVVNAKNYYPFAVPFRAKNGSDKANWDYVGYIDPDLKDAAKYRTHFVIKTYDGAKRAENGENRDANWVIVNRDTYLEPGKGYIISALTYPDKDTATIRIPMTVDNAWLANGEQESITVKEQTTTRNQVTVTAHTGAASDINKGGHQRHAGWNFVANPYLANFAGTNASGSFINGEILINNGEYSYGGEDVPYVTIPTYNFEHYYQRKLSDATLSPAYSFFVQVGTDGTMTFDVAGRQQAPASIAARNAEERPVKMDVDITLSDNHSSDQTGIIISDRYSDAYEIGRDLEKLFGSAYNLSVYTLMADNTPLAFQALAIRSNMQVIPVGYRAPEQGEYTFRLNEATSSIDLLNEQYEQLVLVDYQTGALTNLLNSDYTFYSERTQSDNRFAIYAVPRQNASTDLPNAIGQDKEAQKIIHNGHLYILRNGNVYNGAGQIVK